MAIIVLGAIFAFLFILNIFKDEIWERVVFKDGKIPNYDKLIETVKNAHQKFGYFKLIHWDFSIDESGDPVLIEVNIGKGGIVKNEKLYISLKDKIQSEALKNGLELLGYIPSPIEGGDGNKEFLAYFINKGEIENGYCTCFGSSSDSAQAGNPAEQEDRC